MESSHGCCLDLRLFAKIDEQVLSGDAAIFLF
jgi:hypothetical protein